MTTLSKWRILLLCSFMLTDTALSLNDLPVRWGKELPISGEKHVIRAAITDSHNGIYFSSCEDYTNTTLLKYNQKGEFLWQRELKNIAAAHLAADAQGKIYVIGYVLNKSAYTTKGGHDGFIAQYDPNGKQCWTWSFGTSKHDVCTALDFDKDGNFYVSGYTYGDFARPHQGEADMFIAAYDKDRNLLWKDQMGSPTDERAKDICVVDNNDIYICGNTAGKLGQENYGHGDFVVGKYDRKGKSQWLRQYGTQAYDSIMCMEIGELGHIYMGCRTNGNVGTRNARRVDLDSLIIRLSESGDMLWMHQFGPAGWDGTWDMASFRDGSGDILISGCQIPLRGKCQAYNRRYTPEGELVWTKEFRKSTSSGGTCGRVCAIDSDNNCYHGGWTHADQFGVTKGSNYTYIVRFDGEESTAKDP